MQSHLDEFKAADTVVLGISSSSVEELADNMLTKGLTFPLLADPDLEVIDAFGLRHEGANPFGGDVARPALLIIDESGRIVEKMLTENWRVRPTPEVILPKLKAG